MNKTLKTSKLFWCFAAISVIALNVLFSAPSFAQGVEKRTVTGVVSDDLGPIAGAAVVESILHNQMKMIPCSVYLEGEYGESDICCGVPVILGKNGIEKIVDINLNEEEKAKFAASAAAVRATNAALTEVGAL